MFSCRLISIALLAIVILVTGCAAQPSNVTESVECKAPAPSPQFTCNNFTGFWETESLHVLAGERIVFASPAVIFGNLTIDSDSTVIFRDYNSTWVHGKSSITGDIILDFGKSATEGLFYQFTSLKLHTMPLIHGKESFLISDTTFNIQYHGGCTKVTGALGVSHHARHEFPFTFTASHLSKRGTGNCHWIWSVLSMMSALAVLITVPLIEKFAWKIYD